MALTNLPPGTTHVNRCKSARPRQIWRSKLDVKSQGSVFYYRDRLAALGQAGFVHDSYTPYDLSYSQSVPGILYTHCTVTASLCLAYYTLTILLQPVCAWHTIHSLYCYSQSVTGILYTHYTVIECTVYIRDRLIVLECSVCLLDTGWLYLSPTMCSNVWLIILVSIY